MSHNYGLAQYEIEEYREYLFSFRINLNWTDGQLKKERPEKIVSDLRRGIHQNNLVKNFDF